MRLDTHINLYYPNALDPEKWPRESSGKMNRVTESFLYNIDLDDLQDPNQTTTKYNGSWMRITPWLPWMLMGQTPGHIVYSSFMGAVDSLDELPEDLLLAAEAISPKYLDAPTEVYGPSLSSLERYAIEQTTRAAGIDIKSANRIAVAIRLSGFRQFPLHVFGKTLARFRVKIECCVHSGSQQLSTVVVVFGHRTNLALETHYPQPLDGEHRILMSRQREHYQTHTLTDHMAPEINVLGITQYYVVVVLPSGWQCYWHQHLPRIPGCHKPQPAACKRLCQRAPSP